MEETILTVEQVAQILQVHPFTVLKFIKQGKLKAAKLGRVYRIRRTEVDRFLDAQMGGESTPRPQKPKKSVKKTPAIKDVPGDSSLTDESKGVAVKERVEENEPLREGFEKVQIIEEEKPEDATKKDEQKKEDHYIIDFTY
jgi:excisionase family DNA binding protein